MRTEMRTDEYFLGWSHKYLPPQEKRIEAIKTLFAMEDYWRNCVTEAEEKLKEYYAAKYKPNGTRYSKVPSRSRDYSGGIERKLVTEENLKNNLARMVRYHNDALRTVKESLQSITTLKAKEAVELIHLKGMTASQAGEVLGVTDRHIRRLKGIGYAELILPGEWEKELAA